ncbi:MAG: carboxypeptidase regulatory-like domain-containing protein [Gemmatimonadetes bacterium]|nr:carboxypeptidase regulatory-like domain-containing protein [Gemmatimonadota bacterium]
MPATRSAVAGVVFDSIAGKPLAGAVVQVAIPDSPSAPRTATTDTLGRYRIGELSAGRVIVGFYHDALTELGLDAPMRSVELTAGVATTVDLAIPSSAAIRELRCGVSEPYAQGMLVGIMRDAQTRRAVAGAKLAVHWRAFALDSGDYRVVTERRPATIEADGAFLVCHLPTDVPLDLAVTAPGHRSVDGTVVNVPVMGIGRLEVQLSDTALTTGTAIIRGTVKRESGKAVTSGRVDIKALARDVPIQDGQFVASNVPSGTWVAQARVIGVEPQDVLVTAAESAVTTAVITVGNGPQRLDAVTVVGKPDRTLRVLDDVLRRSRVGMGTTFLPGHPALRSALTIADVMREARGFRQISRDKVTVAGRGGHDCGSVWVYVDDVRMAGGFETVDASVTPREVLAIETWPDIRLAPVQYHRSAPPPSSGPTRRGYGAPPPEPAPCALVLVWTRRRF